MQVKYYFKGLNPAEEKEKAKQYLGRKIEKLNKHLNNKIRLVEVEIEKDKKDFYRVEVQIRIPGHRYIGDEKAQTLEEACDFTCDELLNQIRRDIKKRRTLQKRGAISIKKKFSIDKGARF